MQFKNITAGEKKNCRNTGRQSKENCQEHRGKKDSKKNMDKN